MMIIIVICIVIIVYLCCRIFALDGENYRSEQTIQSMMTKLEEMERDNMIMEKLIKQIHDQNLAIQKEIHEMDIY